LFKAVGLVALATCSIHSKKQADTRNYVSI
jgi:hypothetical protein